MVFIPPSALEGRQCAKSWDSPPKHQGNRGQLHCQLYPPLILWSPWKCSGSWISFPQLCAFVISKQFFPGLVEIRSLPICLWNHDYLYAPLKTASLKTVKKKAECLFVSAFFRILTPNCSAGAALQGCFRPWSWSHTCPHTFFTPSPTTRTQQLLGSSREGLYLCFSSSGKSSLTQAKFNHPVQIGGPWKIPGEEMSISCYFSLSLPSSKAYRGSSSTFSKS